MALETRITRDGKDLSLRWGWWHVTCMAATRAVQDGIVPADMFERIMTMEENFDALKARLQYSQAPGVLDDLINDWLRLQDMFWKPVWDHFWSSEWWDGYVLEEDYRYVDPSDGEVLVLRKGDVLWANIAGR